MKITLQYFDGCPSWQQTQAHLDTLKAEGADIEVDYQLVETSEAAESVGFRGSPTVLVNGIDPFADDDAPIGLSCRVYRTDSGYAGSPSLEQLRDAIAGSP